MPVVDLESLIVEQTKAEIYETALAVASSVGLPVTSWQAGDPTRSLYHLEAEILAALEVVVAGYIRSGFLDYATGDWLKLRAAQDFGVSVPPATFATCDVVLTNTGGGFYPDIEAGDITLKNSTSGKTYRNTTGGTLASGPGTVLTITVVAEDAGSDGSSGAGEIDELVTGLLGVTCTNPLAAVGIDEQDEAVTRQQCRDMAGPLSPNGPASAYSFVCRNPDYGGTSAITRVRVYSDSDTGDVTVYLAGPGGGVSEADRAIGEAAMLDWAVPIGMTLTALAATNVTVDVTYELWLYTSVNKTQAEVEEAVEAALEAMVADRPIGGDIIPPATTGALYKDLIESTIRSVFPQTFRATVSTPAGDTALTNGQVAALGNVVPTAIHFVRDP